MSLENTGNIGLEKGWTPKNYPKKEIKSSKSRLRAAGRWLVANRDSAVLNLILSVLVPLVTCVTLEWIARGSFAPNNQGNGFFQALGRHFPSYLLSFILLLCVYVFISQLAGSHLLATILVGFLGNVPAVVTYFKLTLRGEPFLPWDITQIGDLMGVKDNLSFDIPGTIYVTAVILLLLCGGAVFVKVPRGEAGKPDYLSRFIAAGTALLCGLGLFLGIFLNPKGSAAMGIRPDMWMQDRYYRTNGVITGFLTNLQMLNISQPEGYSAEAVQQIVDDLGQSPGGGLFAGAAADGSVQQPDIIFLMGESFWDVGRLDGIEYDQPVTPNLQALAEEGAYGTAYSPSFGGGTCDVEFEVLTGFSMEFLPAGCKPYQQYTSYDLFSLPQYLKSEGYQTTAVHGYGARFWNRDRAYPKLGIDKFVASEDFVNPSRRRGFISDNAMVERVIEELEANSASGPMFIHAVTMQNHTTYSRDRYPASDLVKVLESPAAIPDSTIGQLEDCATGIREMDAALGKLAEYLRTRERPTILVFWGDHMNPMSDGYALFENTGFIEKGETAAPQLHETPLLIWSNYSDESIDLGTLATYYITPTVLELYGIEMPEMFQYLARQMEVTRGRTRGITILPDGTYTEELTDEQQVWFENHAILQHDFLFGDGVLEDYTPAA